MSLRSFLAAGALAAVACTQPQSEECATYVACRDALDAANNVGEPGLDAYRADGRCWTYPGEAEKCETQCHDRLADIRRSTATLPAACNAAHPEPATTYGPLPAPGACRADRHYPADVVYPQAFRAIERDGVLDLMLLDLDGGVAHFRNDGSGHFTQTRVPATTKAALLAVADVTGDGRPEALVYSTFFGIVTLGFDAHGTLAVIGGGNLLDGVDVTYGDFDGDGRADAFATGYGVDGKVLLAKGDGQGSFAAPRTIVPHFAVGNAPTPIDADEDGDLDVVFGSGGRDKGGLGLGLNDGAGNFTWRFIEGTSLAAGQDLAVADFDGDGHQDVAALGVLHIAPEEPLVLTILFGDGHGGFSDEHIINGFGGDALTAMDVDADGQLDLTAVVDGEMRIVRGLGNRTFAAPTRRLVPALLRGAAVGDFDGDHRMDLATGGLSHMTKSGAIDLFFACRGD